MFAFAKRRPGPWDACCAPTRRTGVQRVQQIEAEGKSHFGPTWDTYINAIGRVNGANQQQLATAMREVLATDDPTSVIAAGGREALINLADGGDEAADRAYAQNP
jgi:hypothetical protein